MATRQTSSSGKTKSPRIQVVLPEELCVRLSALADQESRTVSNMAKVLIQQGLQRLEQSEVSTPPASAQASVVPPASAQILPRNAEQIRSELEAQPPRRLRGAPRRLRLYKPS
ncbi:ribbon-helix-helix domain-containing protein [Synechococcus sp. MIT S9451]|uniref:ribbon-helix-helix domain-containing protein n=1 Tax=Synechococcus sp. MIT S9451 TaxID=3082543 RepID=UPI0039B5B10D